MCGIAGVVERDVRSAALLEEIARNMAAPLEHRGPDANGVWVDVDSGVGLGHQRLSIIDLSPAGAQPMTSGPFTISYNGEIYNADELRGELEVRGVRFRGHSDTEVVLEACAAWGVRQATERLIGMFAFAIWDRRERSLYLVRDRIGIKPLYYCATPERFSFASELKGLRAHPSFNSTIDHDAVGAFLVLDYIPAPLSIYRSAKKLQPGTILRVEHGLLEDVELTPYWTLQDAAHKGQADRFPGTIEEATDELEGLLSDAVSRRLVSDVPIGAFLSGGIDSSVVVALMQRQSLRPVQTFSIGFKNGFDEAPYAKKIAEHLGTEHCEYYISPEEMREHGPAIMGHHDEPFADPSLLPTYFLSRLARRQVTVALSGDGGDELFGGYDRHIMAEKFLKHPALDFGPVAKALIHRIVPVLPRPIRGVWQVFPGMHSGGQPLLTAGEMKPLARMIYTPEMMHHLFAHGSTEIVPGSKLVTGLMDDWLTQCEGLDPSERQQYIDAAGYLPDNILTKVDRASMAVSLEARVPVLDHRIIEFSFCLPASMKTTINGRKRVLRKLLARHVPPAMFERPKRGFRGPLDRWLRGPLRGWVADLSVKSTLSRHGLVDPDISSKRLGFRGIALAAWCETHL